METTSVVPRSECVEHSTCSHGKANDDDCEVQKCPLQKESCQSNIAPPASRGDCGEHLAHLIKCVTSKGNNVSSSKYSWFKNMSQFVGLSTAWQSKAEGSPMGANVMLSHSFGHFYHCFRSSRNPLTIYYLIWAPTTNLGSPNFS